MEVGMSVGGLGSAPLSGAAAVALPAGADCRELVGVFTPSEYVEWIHGPTLISRYGDIYNVLILEEQCHIFMTIARHLVYAVAEWLI
jgi:hypothetical protein